MHTGMWCWFSICRLRKSMLTKFLSKKFCTYLFALCYTYMYMCQFLGGSPGSVTDDGKFPKISYALISHQT